MSIIDWEETATESAGFSRLKQAGHSSVALSILPVGSIRELRRQSEMLIPISICKSMILRTSLEKPGHAKRLPGYQYYMKLDPSL